MTTRVATKTRPASHRSSRLVVLLVIFGLVGIACSSTPSDDTAQPVPTDDVLPATVLPTQVPSQTPTATPPPTEVPTPTSAPIPTTTPAPTATVAPTSTAVPTATVVPPTATPSPTATATAAPNPTATATTAPPIWVGCDIEPDRAVTVGEILTYTALQNPVTAAINFAFDHGDGTIDPGLVSQAFYEAPGLYTVRLQWSYAGSSGTIECGQVRVLSSQGSPTPTPTPPVSISCKVEPSRTVVVGEALTYTASQAPATIPIEYVFDHGDGTWDPGPVSQAYYQVPGFYHVTLSWSYDGRTGVINCGWVTVIAAQGTPTPTPTSLPIVSIGCRISPDGPVAVGEVLTFTALQDPLDVPVQYAFDHGDGTIDPGPVSNAFYQASGTYTVRLNWAHSGQSGQVPCGVVTVTP